MTAWDKSSSPTATRTAEVRLRRRWAPQAEAGVGDGVADPGERSDQRHDILQRVDAADETDRRRPFGLRPDVDAAGSTPL